MATTTRVKITFNGITYRVMCNTVTISGKKSVNVAPYANIAGPVEGQTLAFENLSFNIGGIHLTDGAGTLTWAVLKDLYKHIYEGSAGVGTAGPAILNITYGATSAVTGLESSTDIKVLMKSFTVPIDVGATRDGYIPVGSMILVETS